jgi:DNA-binding protein H-NS
MQKFDVDAMNFDELWLLHEELTKILSAKITAEKLELEKRLAQLNRAEQAGRSTGGTLDQRPRRKYPKVQPKYSNSAESGETWSGRGKQPRWLVAALKAGHSLEEFRIENKNSSRDD